MVDKNFVLDSLTRSLCNLYYTPASEFRRFEFLLVDFVTYMEYSVDFKIIIELLQELKIVPYGGKITSQEVLIQYSLGTLPKTTFVLTCWDKYETKSLL